MNMICALKNINFCLLGGGQSLNRLRFGSEDWKLAAQNTGSSSQTEQLPPGLGISLPTGGDDIDEKSQQREFNSNSPSPVSGREAWILVPSYEYVTIVDDDRGV